MRDQRAQALARVLVSDDEPDAEDRIWIVAWEGRDPTASSPGWFEVPLEASVRGRWVRLIVDTDRVPGWNEIDAVELLGEGRRAEGQCEGGTVGLEDGLHRGSR